MSIPKKRKKMDQPVEPTILVDSTDQVPKEKKPKKTPRTKSKVDSAFEVIEKVDKNITDRAIELKKVNSLAHYSKSEGIHIKFKIDIIRIEDILNNTARTPEEEGLVIDFTIPYPWNLPIIGDVTKAVIRELAKLKII